MKRQIQVTHSLPGTTIEGEGEKMLRIGGKEECVG